MISAAIAYIVAIIVLALVGEANSTWLIVAGWIVALWFVLIGSLSGWQAARR